MSSSKRIAIIGSGASGLTSIKACLEEDLIPFCYEQNENIGGVFLYSDTIRPNQGGSVFSTVTTNTCKTAMCFSDFPMAKEEPMYLPHDRFLKYLNDYAQEFDLLQHIHFNTQVKQVMKSNDYEKSGRWNVCTMNLKTNKKKEETFDGVIVCSGFLKNPIIPNIPGMEKFQGETLNSKTYREPSIFKNKRVLVIGNAYSAGDIAVDATREASKVYLSIGSGTWIFPRFSNGRIIVKNHVTTFTESGAKFDDNSIEDFDIVILATGFEYGADFIDDSIMPKTYEKMQLYKMVWPVILPWPTLAVIGLIASHGPVPPISELEARWFARVFAKKGNLPSKKVMLKEINATKQDVHSRFGKHVMRFIYVTFRDSIADEIGVTPRFWNILFQDPKLAFMCFFGPCFPAQFRLRGPHKWAGASKVCYESYNDTYYASILTRKRNDKQKKTSIAGYLGILVLLLGILGYGIFRIKLDAMSGNLI